ncbi:tenascin-like [Frankliniella occidentalis]|uniref:Tenascin-like n=1 Tax=Frankliniella occidentalis TaxID=133901 RepID=A0A6J1SNL9_FRAOC|nr:tenascin-like [Frankliniella occidentalis]
MPPQLHAAVVVTAALVLLAVASVDGARQQGDTVEVGELVLVRLNVTGSGGVVAGFMMCDAKACSKVELWSIETSKARAIRYKAFVDCNSDGWGGTEALSNAKNSTRQFPASTLLLVTRASDQLLTVKLLHDRTGMSATNVALSKTMNRLYIKDHWSETFSPANMTLEFLPSAEHHECANGGVAAAGASGSCECAHGFDGPSCETACGPNRYGPGCSSKCSGHGRGCRGVQFKDVQQPDTKICGAGLHGLLCDQVCGPGLYGPGCTLSCGQCDPDRTQCDPYTGQCPAGCRPGYHGPSCQRALTHLTVGPDITNVTDTSISGTFAPSTDNVKGSGVVSYYDVQYREADGAGLRAGNWVSGAVVGRLPSNWSGSPKLHDFVVRGLRPGAEHEVRVVLLDNALRGYEAVPRVRVSTTGARLISDIIVYDVTARAANISWFNPAGVAVLVQYECVKLLACSDDCSQASGMFIIDELENRTSASVEGLLPGATYRVLVSHKNAAREQAECATFTTPFTVPDAVPEAVVEGDEVADKSGAGVGVAAGPGVVSVSNVSATIRWRMPESCVDLNGIVSGTWWQLFFRAAVCPQGCSPVEHSSSGLTTSMELELESLQPSTAYELRLWLYNTEGYNRERYLRVGFTTARNAPAA